MPTPQHRSTRDHDDASRAPAGHRPDSPDAWPDARPRFHEMPPPGSGRAIPQADGEP